MAESPNMAKYVALFGEDFAPIVNALQNQLNPAVEAQILNIMDDLTLRSEIFGREIKKTVTRLASQGASTATIKSILNQDMITGGKLFGSLRNDIKEGVVEQINQSGRLGQMEEYKNAQDFMWITVQGHKVCPDCAARAGQVMAWDDWVSDGLPGSGWSVCGGHCYCVLDPSGKIPPVVKAPPQVQEPRVKTRKAPISPAIGRTTYTDFDKGYTATKEYWRSDAGKALQPTKTGLLRYFAEDYLDINKVARGQSKESLYVKYHDDMKKGFENAPAFRGKSYRGAPTTKFDDRIKKYKDNIGGIVTEDMFLSTTKSPSIAGNWKRGGRTRIEFTYEGKSGLIADGLEAYEEFEILFNSKSTFEVVDVIIKENHRTFLGGSAKKYEKIAHIILKEV